MRKSACVRMHPYRVANIRATTERPRGSPPVPAKQHYAEHASDASEADSSAPVGTRSVNAPARHNLLMA